MICFLWFSGSYTCVRFFGFSHCYQLRLMASPSISPPLLHSSAPGSKPCGECASNRAVSYQSVEGIYTFENDFGCVLQKGSDSPEPCLRTSLPEEKTQVGGTHGSFVNQSARPQIRLVLTWRNKFPFHSTT